MIKANELRIGNLFNPETPVMVEPFMLQPENKVVFIPIPLTEDWMVKFRRNIRPDFNPIEFQKVPPGERQGREHVYWSSFIHEDYKLCLQPNYKYRKEGDEYIPTELEFWFCWYHEVGSRFIPLMNIREHKLLYVHQLQNLFFTLTGEELIVK